MVQQLLSEKEKEVDENKIGEAIDRIHRCFRFLILFIFHLFSREKFKGKFTMIKSNMNETIVNNQVCLIIDSFFNEFSFLCLVLDYRNKSGWQILLHQLYLIKKISMVH